MTPSDAHLGARCEILPLSAAPDQSKAERRAVLSPVRTAACAQPRPTSPDAVVVKLGDWYQRWHRALKIQRRGPFRVAALGLPSDQACPNSPGPCRLHNTSHPHDVNGEQYIE